MPRKIVRAIHAGVAGVLFLLLPIAIAGDEFLGDGLLHVNRDGLRFFASWLALAFVFLAVALLVSRANAWLLVLFALVDVPSIKFFWDTVKGALLAPALAFSVLCLLVEAIRQLSLRKRLAT